jgi:3-phenylpropionate/trans-cinnamate dioxygenase ferredoxin subunit
MGKDFVSMISTNRDWVQTIEFSDLEENRPALTHVKGIPVVLIRTGYDVYAISNSCAHMGCPLADGLLEGDFLRCPCHEWAFDIQTGELWEAPEIRIPTYDVKVEMGWVWVHPEEQRG